MCRSSGGGHVAAPDTRQMKRPGEIVSEHQQERTEYRHCFHLVARGSGEQGREFFGGDQLLALELCGQGVGRACISCIDNSAALMLRGIWA